jgi:hypothetical protein
VLQVHGAMKIENLKIDKLIKSLSNPASHSGEKASRKMLSGI